MDVRDFKRESQVLASTSVGVNRISPTAKVKEGRMGVCAGMGLRNDVCAQGLHRGGLGDWFTRTEGARIYQFTIRKIFKKSIAVWLFTQ